MQCYPAWSVRPRLGGRVTGCLYLGSVAQEAGHQERSCQGCRAGVKAWLPRVTRGAPALPQAISRPCVCLPLAGSEPNLLVRACNQLGQFLQHRETNLRYLALESMCTLASSEFSHEAVKTHIDTVINALKVRPPALPAAVSSASS